MPLSKPKTEGYHQPSVSTFESANLPISHIPPSYPISTTSISTTCLSYASPFPKEGAKLYDQKNLTTCFNMPFKASNKRYKATKSHCPTYHTTWTFSRHQQAIKAKFTDVHNLPLTKLAFGFSSCLPFENISMLDCCHGGWLWGWLCMLMGVVRQELG